jgi:hypothetical protein
MLKVQYGTKTAPRIFSVNLIIAFLFHIGQSLFVKGGVISFLTQDTQDYVSFPINTGFSCVHVLFKTGFTVL